MAKKTIGIDIGSNSITIYREGDGVIVNESTRIAIDINTKEPISYGDEAGLIERRTPGSVLMVNPVFEGSVYDHDGLEMVLEEMFRQAGINKPEVIVTFTSAANEAERNALAGMLYNLGARNVEYITMPTACVLGSRCDLADDRAFITLDIGAGVTDIGVVKGCVTRYEHAVKYGCNKLDAAVAAYIKRERSLAVSDETLSEIRKKIGSVDPSFDAGSLEFRGRDLVTGLPVRSSITSAETRTAMSPIAKYICRVVNALVKGMSGTLAADVAERGVLLSGGGALTGGMDELVRAETGLPVTMSPNPTDCIIDGIGAAIENRDVFDMLIKEL